MIDLEKAYGLPPHKEQEPFSLGDKVKLRPFPDKQLLPPLEDMHAGNKIVLETRLYGEGAGVKYQQVRFEDGWTASYWWELDQ